MVKSVYHRFFSFYHLVIFKSGRFISPGQVAHGEGYDLRHVDTVEHQ